MQKQLQSKTISINFFSLKGGEFDLFEFTMLFQKHFCPFASSCQIPKTSKTLSKTFGNFQKRKCSPVEKNILLRLLKNSMHMELINDVKLHLKTFAPKNSSQIHSLSRLHQAQMNFTENEVLLQKVDVKHHLPKITKSPCFCIQIQMSPHRSASFPEFRSTVLSKTSKHSHHTSYMQET